MIVNKLLEVRPIKYYLTGRNFLNDNYYLESQRKNDLEIIKKPTRTEIINFLLSLQNNDTYYLEIGVSNPDYNFNHIKASTKYGVDPGVDFIENPVDFKMSSDDFFHKISNNEILSNDIRFDVIFIDGLHHAEQVDRDIMNALNYIKDEGFIVIHDCSPPSEWHAREQYHYYYTPAFEYWNGTTWKAFLKWRFDPSVSSCCIDSDWGVGILSKKIQIGKHLEIVNPFFEFGLLDKNRKEYLNLIEYNDFERILKA